MINFSGLNYKSWVGKLLRLPLHLLPANMEMPIWQGRLKGQRWIVGSFNHGCWLGSYEFDKQKCIAAVVKPGGTFFDVGAHVGFYSLLASSLVGESGKVFAFEPCPRNIAYLERHLQINAVRNVNLIKAAVSDHFGELRFQLSGNHSMGQLSERGQLSVQCVALDDLYAQGLIPVPDVMKIDVEGAEALVLQGAKTLLTENRPIIFLATHGPLVHAECLKLLGALGYACSSLEKDKSLETCQELVAAQPGDRRWQK